MPSCSCVHTCTWQSCVRRSCSPRVGRVATDAAKRVTQGRTLRRAHNLASHSVSSAAMACVSCAADPVARCSRRRVSASVVECTSPTAVSQLIDVMIPLCRCNHSSSHLSDIRRTVSSVKHARCQEQSGACKEEAARSFVYQRSTCSEHVDLLNCAAALFSHLKRTMGGPHCVMRSPSSSLMP